MGKNVRGLRSIIGRNKIDRGKLRIAWERRCQRTYMHDPQT